jgi:tRNA threonylcarbamoyl adenosine modification protein (Sua5/YciO/YrdC/YwlC family)
MLLEIHPDNPQPRRILQVVEILQNGGVIIFPTDSVYAMGCDIRQSKAFEKLCRIKGIKPQKAQFSFLLSGLSHISEYTKPFDREVFKLLKANLPGPYTYILEASNLVPTLFRNNRKTIGIRVPNCEITRQLIEGIGGPLVSTSIHNDSDQIMDYLSDPEEIHSLFGKDVDLVIDGGPGKIKPSSVIDCTGPEPIIVRE